MRGAETFIYELAKRLSIKHEVDVISDINYLKIFKKKYDIVIPTNGRWQAVLVRIITFLTGAKMVISGQSGIGFDDRVNLLAFPNTFVALTEFQKMWAGKVNPFIRIEKIPNGVDLNKFHPKPKSADRAVKTVLAVGAFTKEKGHLATIAAVSGLKNVKLLIVGSGGPEKQYLEQAGKKVLGERFETKSVPFSQMPDVYRSANAFVYPTVPWESFGIAILEALASGLPVVVSDDPIRREIVGDAGYFINPAKTESYTAAIRTALDTSNKNKSVNQARKYDWDKIALAYENLFSRLVRIR